MSIIQVYHSLSPQRLHMPIRAGVSFFRSLVLIAILAIALTPAAAQSSRYAEAFTAYQNQKFTDAESIWLELANAGDVNAQYALGVMHLRQEASDASPAAAFSWFEKAAGQGHATAMFNLGVAYWEGTGVGQNKGEALDLWEQSAEKGDSGAQFNLGLAYYIGEERNPDLAQAAKWIGRAAKQNHPEARRILKVIDAELGQAATADEPQPATGVNTPVGSLADADSDRSTDTNTTSEAREQQEQVVVATAAPASPSVPVTSEPKNRYWKTINRAAPMYDTPGGIVFREVPAGTPLDVTGQDGGWAKVTFPEGIKTWIYSRFIEVDGNVGTINATAVRVRPEPTTDNSVSPPLGKYSLGARVIVLRQVGEWVQIRAPQDIGAWLRVDDIIQYEDTAENRTNEWESAKARGA